MLQQTCFKIQYELNSARCLQTRGDMAENTHGLSALGDTKGQTPNYFLF